MTEEKKEGFFKRLFGGNKSGCCGVTIEEVKEENKEEKSDSMSSSGCCSPESKNAQ